MASSALKRLHKDLAEIEQNPLPTVYARPVSESNLLEWHGNIVGVSGTPYEGHIFHVIFSFSSSYPNQPPKIRLMTTVPRSHVYGEWLCLDMLEVSHFQDKMYSGWSTAYSVQSILLQLQSYLFVEDEVYYKPTVSSIEQAKKGASQYACSSCSHDMSVKKPWPINYLMAKQMRSLWKFKLQLEEQQQKQNKKNPTPRPNAGTSVAKNVTRGVYLYGINLNIPIVVEPERPKEYFCNNKKQKRHKKRPVVEMVVQKPVVEVIQEPVVEVIQKPVKLVQQLNPNVSNTVSKQKIDLLKKLPSHLVVHDILPFLNGMDLLRVADVCKMWKKWAVQCTMHHQHNKDGTICFHSKVSYKHTILGVGLTLRKNPYSGEIAYVNSPLDLLSKESFEEEKVRMGVWREKFTHWLPIFLDQEHGTRAFPLFEQAICQITGTKEFKPSAAVRLMCQLMNTQVVNIMNGHLHCSIKGLTGYSYFHRWLIALCEKYPQQVQEEIDSRIENFIHFRRYRNKKHVPIIGDFVALLSMCKQSWEDVISSLLNEVFARNVLWLLKTYPMLHFKCSDKKARIQAAFQSSKVMNRLLMFHYKFLKLMARPGNTPIATIKHTYDKLCGQPSFILQQQFQVEVFNIMKVNSYQDFLGKIKFDELKSCELHDYLLRSMTRSMESGYHRPLPRSITTQEQVKQWAARTKSTKNTDTWSPWSKQQAETQPQGDDEEQQLQLSIIPQLDSRKRLVHAVPPVRPEEEDEPDVAELEDLLSY